MLLFASLDVSAAYAYFNAAIDTGYEFIMIHDSAKDRFYPEDREAANIQDWKNNFYHDENDMGIKINEKTVSLHGTNWFFCKKGEKFKEVGIDCENTDPMEDGATIVCEIHREKYSLCKYTEKTFTVKKTVSYTHLTLPTILLV